MRVSGDADGAVADLIRAIGVASAHADVRRIWILRRPKSERIFDDDRRVIADANLPIDDLLSVVRAQELLIARACLPPAGILDKVSSARRFIDIGRPQCGQRGTSSVGTVI